MGTKQNIYNCLLEEHDEDTVKQLTQRVIDARDAFFVFISTFDGSPRKRALDDDNVKFHDESLWSYFEVWLGTLTHDLYFEPTHHLWLDPRAAVATWLQFLRLVPSIYIAIIDEYLQYPSKLDQIRLDPETGQETRIARSVKLVGPVFAVYQDRGEEPREPLSPEDAAHASIAMLVTGARGDWPLADYGKSSPSKPLRDL